jgi:glutathione S-transferase
MEDRPERDREREIHKEDLDATRPMPGNIEKPPREYEEPAIGGTRAPLFSPEETESFRSEWSGILSGFVDEPRQSVERADALVARLMKRLDQVFAGERSELERQWDRGDRISTEDLRVALTKYRSFVDRLLSF